MQVICAGFSNIEHVTGLLNRKKKILANGKLEFYHTAGLVICLGGVSFPEATIILHFSRSFISRESDIFSSYILCIFNLKLFLRDLASSQSSIFTLLIRPGRSTMTFAWTIVYCIGTFNTRCNYLTYVTSVQLEVLITFFLTNSFLR